MHRITHRKLIAGVAVGILLVFSFMAIAAPTTDQTSKIKAIQAKMLEAQKEMINIKAKVGLITQEQADAMIERLEARQVQAKELTAEQEKELADAYAKQVELRKEMVNAQVEAGTITKEQGDNMLKKIEAEAAYQEKMGFSAPQGFGRGRHGRGSGGGMMGMMSDWNG